MHLVDSAFGLVPADVGSYLNSYRCWECGEWVKDIFEWLQLSLFK